MTTSLQNETNLHYVILGTNIKTKSKTVQKRPRSATTPRMTTMDAAMPKTVSQGIDANKFCPRVYAT